MQCNVYLGRGGSRFPDFSPGQKCAVVGHGQPGAEPEGPQGGTTLVLKLKSTTLKTKLRLLAKRDLLVEVRIFSHVGGGEGVS